MPTKPRSAIGDIGLFHVYNRGNNKSTIFHSDDDRRCFREIVLEAKMRFGIRIYHYVQMYNHYHFILEAREPTSLSAMMKQVGQTYSKHVHDTSGGLGHLWQGRFKSKIIKSELYYQRCAAYIELNPVRAKLCSDPSDFRWSSYGATALGNHNPLVDVSGYLMDAGQTPTERQAAHRYAVKQLSNYSLSKDDQQWIYGFRINKKATVTFTG